MSNKKTPQGVFYCNSHRHPDLDPPRHPDPLTVIPISILTVIPEPHPVILNPHTVILNSFQNPQIIENWEWGNGKWEMGNGRTQLSASRLPTFPVIPDLIRDLSRQASPD